MKTIIIFIFFSATLFPQNGKGFIGYWENLDKNGYANKTSSIS